MKKILFILTIAASVFIIKDLAYSIYTLWHKNDLLVVAQRQLAKEKHENNMLKAKLAEAKKAEFIESEARNKLFLVKPGESVVILPSSKEKEHKKARIAKKANWEQWYELFFH